MQIEVASARDGGKKGEIDACGEQPAPQKLFWGVGVRDDDANSCQATRGEKRR